MMKRNVSAKHRFHLGALSLMILSAAACGKKDGSSSSESSLTLTGALGSGLNGSALIELSRDIIDSLRAPGAGILATSTASKADSILAVPLYQGQMNSWAMPYAIKGTIETSGKLSITLNKSQDYVILLLDTSKSKKIDQVVGYLNLADASKGLMRIPAQNVSGSSMEVGTVTQSSGSTSANSSKTLDDLSSNFSVNLALLRELARTDSILQIAKNIYTNYTSATEFADTSPYFAFNGSQSAMLNKYSGPENIPYSGYGLYFNLTKPGLKIGDVCATSGAKVLKLTPPSSITSAVDPQQGGTGDTFASVDNTGVSGLKDRGGGRSYCGGSNSLGAGSVYVHGVPSEESFSFNWGAGNGFAGSIAEGEWVLAVDNTEVGRFDLKSAAVVDANGKPTVYVPSIKLELDSSNLIKSVSVKLYTYDKASSSFVQVTDLTGFKAAAKYPQISITDYGQSPSLEKLYNLTEQSDGTYTLSSFDGIAWKQGTYGTGTSQNPATTSIAFTYSLYGASMRFDFRN